MASLLLQWINHLTCLEGGGVLRLLNYKLTKIPNTLFRAKLASLHDLAKLNKPGRNCSKPKKQSTVEAPFITALFWLLFCVPPNICSIKLFDAHSRHGPLERIYQFPSILHSIHKKLQFFCSYCFVWEAMRTKIYTYTLHFLWCIYKVAIQQVDTFLLYHEHRFNKLGTISIYLLEI